jgi:hypothetical protein
MYPSVTDWNFYELLIHKDLDATDKEMIHCEFGLGVIDLQS